MSFSSLREKLSQTPSRALFTSLCKLLESWEDSDIELALEYTEEHIESWSEDLRHAEDIAWNRKFPVWWPLLRSYRHKKSVLPKKWEKQPERLEHLTHFSLNCSRLKIAPSLWFFPNLTHLELYDSLDVANIEPLISLEHLRHLKISFCYSLQDISPLSKLTNLTSLQLQDAEEVVSLDALSKLTNLEELALSDAFKFKSIEPLRKLTNLRSLELTYCDSLQDIDAITNMPQLRNLDLEGHRSLEAEPTKPHMKTREEVVTFQEKLQHVSK